MTVPSTQPPSEPRTAIDITRLIPMVSFMLRLSQLRLFEAFQAEMGHVNVTPARYALLAVLHDNPDSRAGQIADVLRVKHSNMAALLNQLEDEGLIQRVKDVTERRASLVRLTPQGEALFAEVDPRVIALENRLLEAVPAEQRAALLTQLARFAGIL